jgi:hypothetical protein
VGIKLLLITKIIGMAQRVEIQYGKKIQIPIDPELREIIQDYNNKRESFLGFLGCGVGLGVASLGVAILATTTYSVGLGAGALLLGVVALGSFYQSIKKLNEAEKSGRRLVVKHFKGSLERNDNNFQVISPENPTIETRIVQETLNAIKPRHPLLQTPNPLVRVDELKIIPVTDRLFGCMPYKNFSVRIFSGTVEVADGSKR